MGGVFRTYPGQAADIAAFRANVYLSETKNSF
jgi:hypothetical protein